ncbi:MAG: LLM class flavin-dependent oxidoreductase [Actinomycetaceae bacterium]|nr:LLM class flavin-dependent oxidoreductase [Actinomycetaceae bacterium]MDU0970782.1 LLM class flavin-dependent oxidoreductase [Actinomycetaceae bacterium]
MRVPLSFLDLAPASAGRTRKDALDDAVLMARTAEDAGYKRYWMAEHHGSPVFMSSATSLLLARAAENTSTIRLGAGGVMLPNHSPLVVAEHFGTLATIYGERFDLGLGRAPGTDPVTAKALRRGAADTSDFVEDVKDLIQYFSPVPDDQAASGAEAAAVGENLAHYQDRDHVRAVPGEGVNVPLLVLGSSLRGASVAADLGLPYVFASHFAPHMAAQAMLYYRDRFKAKAETAQIEQPYVIAGVNVLVAPTHEEAEVLFTSYAKFRRDIAYGRSGPLPEPIPEEAVAERKRVDARAVVGTPEEVRDFLDQFVERHHVDELVCAMYAWDPEMRRRSAKLLADVWNK